MEQIKELIKSYGGLDPDSFDAELIEQMIETSLRLGSDNHHTGQLKLIARALKEMWYAYRVFNRYPSQKRVSLFGSARTPETHPDYKAACTLSKLMQESGWMCITGAANGIMKAGHEGAGPQTSFGLAIRLAFESGANSFIEGDPKLIHFRYFFIRKLMFMSHSDAVAVFPGGVGTQDELFEVLTLMQTGKSNIVPVVLVEGAGGSYWQKWLAYVKENLLGNAFIDAQDLNFFYIAPTPELAWDHIQQFYRRYHSNRYVGELFVMRLKSKIPEAGMVALQSDFASLLQSGSFEQTEALPAENEYMDLPRLVFRYTRENANILRRLIDAINRF